MKKLKISVLFTVVFLSLVLSSCNNIDTNIYNNYEYFGANLKAVLYTDSSTFSKWQEQAETVLEGLSATFDEKTENSDINRFNNAPDGQYTEVGEETYNLVVKAKNIYALTSGAYNPCVYYLVDLWGFSTRFSLSKAKTTVYDRDWTTVDGAEYLPLPETEYIEAFSALADFDKITCKAEDGKYYLVKNDTLTIVDGISYYAKIDLGGLIKGYAIDKLTALTEGLGITQGYINYGTSSIALLKNSSDSYWDLLLTNPRYTVNSESDVYLKMQVMDEKVASSGDYESYYVIDGVRYSHIIDATTGRPVNNGVCAVTVLCTDACLADMLSTALCVMGKEKVIAFMESDYCLTNNIKIIMAYDTGDKIEVVTNSNTDNVTISDDNFYLAG